MEKYCDFPLCKSPVIEDSRWCFHHNRVYGEKKPKKEVKPIPKQSEKRKELDKEYKKLVKQMLSDNDRCEMKISGVCTGKAQGLHHIEKRTEKNLCDLKILKRSCNACNSWVEKFPKEAKKLGLVKSKFKPHETNHLRNTPK